MVRRSNFSVENTPERKGFEIISRPKKKNPFKQKAFILPLLCTLLALAAGFFTIVASYIIS